MKKGIALEHAGTRERLLEAAGRLFAASGFDGASVRDIARAANANLGAVAYHFGGKEGLFAAVVAGKIAPLRGEVEAILRGRASPEQKLRRMLEVFAMHVLHRDPSLKAMFMELLAGGRRLPAEAMEGIGWRNRAFAGLVRRGVADGTFRRCDIECAAWSYFGMLSAYILFEPLVGARTRMGAYPVAFVKRVVACALDLFMKGLKKR